MLPSPSHISVTPVRKALCILTVNGSKMEDQSRTAALKFITDDLWKLFKEYESAFNGQIRHSFVLKRKLDLHKCEKSSHFPSKEPW
jgi:hypothetical protein